MSAKIAWTVLSLAVVTVATPLVLPVALDRSGSPAHGAESSTPGMRIGGAWSRLPDASSWQPAGFTLVADRGGRAWPR